MVGPDGCSFLVTFVDRTHVPDLKTRICQFKPMMFLRLTQTRGQRHGVTVVMLIVVAGRRFLYDIIGHPAV